MRALIKQLVLMIMVSLMACGIGYASGKEPANTTRQGTIVVKPDTPELEETLAWYRDAKLGMFIHWGLYSVIGQGEWTRLQNQIPDEEYRAIAARFNPVDFDADAWVRLAKRAGMKWITITAKHHDGFAIYPSRADGFDIEATPFKRDLLAELREACDRHGLKLGFYYSQYQDWDHPGGGHAYSTYAEKTERDFTRYMEEKAVPQVKELMARYQPFLFWFDTPQHLSPAESMRLRQLVHEFSPGTMVNGRIGHGLGDYWNVRDNAVPAQPYGEVWETPMTTTGSWGWRGADHPLEPRPLGEVIQSLTTVVSYGGNVLLNVGPSPEGLIGAYEQELLGDLGQWLGVNGEAIYGTGMSPFYDSPYICTTRPGKLYFHIFDWPAGEFRIERLRNNINSAYLLADEKRLAVRQEKGSVVISLPREAPDPHNSILVVEIQGPADVENDYRTNDTDGTITIPAAEVVPLNERFGRFDESTGVLAVLRSSRSQQTGQFRVSKPGRYRLIVEQAADAFQDEVYWVRINYQKLDIGVRDTGSRSRFTDVKAGVVEFEEAGVYNLTLQPQDFWIQTDQVLVYLKSLRLEPEFRAATQDKQTQ